MNFQQLRFVVAVAEHESFTRAADECGVTQPALSNAISQLEEELGAKLFARTTRSVKLTGLGELLVGEMRGIVDARRRLIKHAAEFLARDHTTIRIALSPLVSDKFVETMLSRIGVLNPELNIVLTEMNKADIQPALDGGTVDFGLGPAPILGDHIRSVQIYREPLLFVSGQHNTETNRAARLRDLEGEQFLLAQEDCGLSEAVRVLFRNNGLPLIEYEGRALGYHILEKWAQLGIGITLLPASKVSDLTTARRLDDADGAPVTITFEAGWNMAQEARPCFQTIKSVLTPGPSGGTKNAKPA